MARRANGTGTLYRRNGWYYGQLKVGGGIMRKALDTRDKREAIKRLDVLAKGFDLGDEERLAALAVHLKPKTGRHSFGEAWIAYLRAPENLAQPETARVNNKTMWNGFMRWLHGQDIPRSRLNCKAAYPGTDCLDDISEKIAGEFVEWVKKNRSPETANKYVRVLKRVWNLNKASENPWASFRKFKVKSIQRRAFSKDEVDKIIDAADGELKVLFTIGAYTGMRMGDCQRLRYESIDESAGVIRTGKTGRIIRIPIHPVLKKALASKVRCGVGERSTGTPFLSLTSAMKRRMFASYSSGVQKRSGTPGFSWRFSVCQQSLWPNWMMTKSPSLTLPISFVSHALRNVTVLVPLMA